MRVFSKNIWACENIVCYIGTLLVVGFGTLAVVLVTTTPKMSSTDSDKTTTSTSTTSTTTTSTATPPTTTEDSGSEFDLPVVGERYKSYFWGYLCENSKCNRVEITDVNLSKILSLSVCHLTCLNGATLWPIPTGEVSIGKSLVQVDLHQILFNPPNHQSQLQFWDITEERFFKILQSKFIDDVGNTPRSSVNINNNLLVNVIVADESLELNLETYEGFRLIITGDEDQVQVEITCETYYGCRHGVETLSQLIVFDDIFGRYVLPTTVDIIDAPVYKYRGVLIDTARRFYSVESIKRTIDAMALVKLNHLHWHITDSQSFPMKLDTHPELSIVGAYSPHQVYDPATIIDIVSYARVRGIRVIPELDAPAHTAEGWQQTGVLTCYNKKPWGTYCAGPPCGQLDVTKEKLYEILDDIYREMDTIFDKPDLFHMGGDEVNNECWKSDEDIKEWMNEQGWTLTTKDFLNLWKYFQNRVENIWGNISDSKIIIWTSHLTDENDVETYLDPNKYILQVWTEGTNEIVNKLLEKGYKLIMSNVDAWYLDCGFGAYVNAGVNWCSPYKPWPKVYDNNLKNLANGREDQILGGEACLWSSINDDNAMDSRLWPRVSALAERLWAEPSGNFRVAEQRMIFHREFLVRYGIAAESIQPEWCLQHGGDCIL